MTVGLDTQVVAVSVGGDGTISQGVGGDGVHADGVVGHAAVSIITHTRGLGKGAYNGKKTDPRNI